jgi:predicted acyl esterase
VETYYSPEAQAVQLRFFDCFLKGVESGLQDVPRVRQAFYAQDVRGDTDWPLPGATTRSLYLRRQSDPSDRARVAVNDGQW